MIGVILACWWFGRRRNISVLHILDVGSLGCAPGLFLGRLANFVNGELHGRPAPNQINPRWWSMKFPQEMHEWPAARLANLQEVVGLVGERPDDWLTAVDAIAANPDFPPKDAMLHVNTTVNQLIEATQNGNQAVIDALRPLLTAFYPSQIFQAITDGPILLGTLALIWLAPRKPGVVGSWFLIIYGVLRIITEVFRQPDQGVALTSGLSRGQLLSLLMVAAGIVCLRIASLRIVQPLGGLFRRV
jgi:phosphatidylglycerol:prolipoprotein diacylglycerol transferase